MSVFHTFDVETACQSSLEESVFLGNMTHWVIVNRSNQRNFHQGRTWTYNTLDAFTKIFPYWSVGQIRRIIDKLLERGLIVTGNFNEDNRDQTKWYAFADEETWFGDRTSPKREPKPEPEADSHLSESANAPVETDKSHSCRNQQMTDTSDGKQAKKKSKETAADASVRSDFTLFNEAWDKAYQEHFGMKFHFDGRNGKAVKVLLSIQGQTIDSLISIARRAWGHISDRKNHFYCGLSDTIYGFASNWNKIRVELDPPENVKERIAKLENELHFPEDFRDRPELFNAKKKELAGLRARP